VARRGDGDEKLSLYIRVAESAIYNGKPVLKALLKEVIFMRMHDLHEGDLRIPKGTPWSKDYRKYEGWCFARQEYLAGRVGCEYKYANQALLQIVEDRYLETRKYRGKDGAWHKQYFPDEGFIDYKIAELEASADKSADNPDATPYRDNHDKPIVLNKTAPSSLTREATLDNHDSPIVINTTKVVSEVCLEGGRVSKTLRQPPSGAIAAAQLHQEKSKPNPVEALSTQAKTKATPRRESLPPGVSWAKVQAEKAKARGATACACGHWDVDETHFCELEI